MIHPLMEDLTDVPRDYILQVSQIKRVLERWTMDPAFRRRFEEDQQAAITSMDVPLEPREIRPLVIDAEARALTEALRAGQDVDYPLAVRRYRAFYREKRLHRRQIRRNCQASHPTIAAWRARQVNRCVGELGIAKADALVHAPASFELSSGCSVGCWFCGVDASRFQGYWPHNDTNATLWRETLQVLKEVMGPCVRQGFLYWATDPLDNLDYEKFLVDFHRITGRCPQTTTALGARDLERTRRLLQLSHSLGSEIDRFSIVSLKMLAKIHAHFQPEELIRVECIPQNREAADKYRKANAGRARRFAERRTKEVMPHLASSTIACVSGFLFRMPERTFQLITPCNANERWPLGYWVVAERSFSDAEDLRAALTDVIDRHMRPLLRVDDHLRLRPDLTWEVDGDELRIRSPWIKITLRGHRQPEVFLEMLEEGRSTAAEIALQRERISGVALEETFLVLNEIFHKGLLDEEPQPLLGIEPLARPA